MRLFLNQIRPDNVQQDQAFPIFETVAVNDNPHNSSLKDFEHDDPPPYRSSIESEESDDVPPPPPPPICSELPEELKAIMERPLSDDELRTIVALYDLNSTLNPVYPYQMEAELENNRLQPYYSNKIFQGLEGERRRGVIVRHSVKRRLVKLGVWNPEWGFAGRNVQPNDDAHQWKWRWQEHKEDSGASRPPSTQQLLASVLDMRRNLRRGECSPVIPRSHLDQDTTASKAESFITTRPWFVFQVEVAEEQTRYFRLSREQRDRYQYSPRDQIIQWWKERGHWKEEFNKNERVTSWKWPHESLSPEPEDLTPISSKGECSFETDMDFTPSEISDLETIELPRSEQPENFWTIGEADPPPYFPGQTANPAAKAQRARRREPPSSAPREWLGPTLFPLFRQQAHEEVSQEQCEKELEVKTAELQESISRGPQRPKFRRKLRDKADRAQDRNDRPPPRRSARIAGMKRPAEPLPSETGPSKRPRSRVAMEAAAPNKKPKSKKPKSST
jgi:hypothetical protein